jgi:HEPN domain-containing protein
MSSPDPGAGWIAKAEADLAFAQALLFEEDLPAWGACFHAQQAAEKAIKRSSLSPLSLTSPPKSWLVSRAGQ